LSFGWERISLTLARALRWARFYFLAMAIT